MWFWCLLSHAGRPWCAKCSAQNLWEGSCLTDRLRGDLTGVHEAAWSLGDHSPPSQRRCSPTGESFLTARRRAPQLDGSAALPCSLELGTSRSGGSSPHLSYRTHPGSGAGKGTSRRFLASAPPTSGCSSFWAVRWLTASPLMCLPTSPDPECVLCPGRTWEQHMHWVRRAPVKSSAKI